MIIVSEIISLFFHFQLSQTQCPTYRLILKTMDLVDLADQADLVDPAVRLPHLHRRSRLIPAFLAVPVVLMVLVRIGVNHRDIRIGIEANVLLGMTPSR